MNQKHLPGRYEYDVTVSYSGNEMKTIVAPLCMEMKKYGLRYFVAREQIAWGENITERISRALAGSRYILAIISEAYLHRAWTSAELQSTLHAQISDRKILLLPLLVGNDDQVRQILQHLPLLRQCKYLIWKNNPHDIALAIVERIIRSSGN